MNRLTYIFIFLCGLYSMNGQSIQDSITKLLQDHLRTKGKRPVQSIMVYLKNDSNNFKYHNGVGIRGRDTTRISKDHQYRIASITKTFVATIILQLYEEGKIGLDQPITNYLSGNKLEDTQNLHIHKGENLTESITVRMLLNHTSGIADVFTDARFRWNLSVLLRPKKTYSAESFFKKFFKYGLNKKTKNPPGEGYHYTDIGYMVLGFIIEDITGKDLTTVLRNRILEPLNLQNTYFEYYEAPVGHGKHIDVYLNRINMTKKVNTSYEWAGGGLVSTTMDLGIFFEKLFDNQLFKQKTTLDLMTDLSDAKEFGVEYGLGITKYTFNNNTFFGHSGFYGSLTMYSPDKGITFSANIAQVNLPYNSEALINRILEIALD